MSCQPFSSSRMFCLCRGGALLAYIKVFFLELSQKQKFSCHFEASASCVEAKDWCLPWFSPVSDISCTLRNWKRSDLGRAFVKGLASLPPTWVGGGTINMASSSFSAHDLYLARQVSVCSTRESVYSAR